MALNERVRIALIHAGWTPERAWDTARARRAHESRGISFHAAAEAFLRRFGGLTIGNGAAGGLLVSTDPVEALERVSDPELSELEVWIGEPVVVVGFAQGGAQLLVISERGAVFGAKQEVLVAYGTDVGAMFDRICAERLVKRYDLN
jgi:hypothetical protein